MSIYLIDYENTSVSGLDGISSLCENDSIYIFYSENADRLTFGLHRRLSECKAKVNYMKVETETKNSLDFQLVSYLGFLINENKDATYFIVSKDKGFGSVSKFWIKRKIRVNCAINATGKNVLDENLDIKSTLKDILDCKHIEIVVGFIQKYKTKQGLNNALVTQFKSEKAGEIYKVLKPFIADKKGK